MCVNVLGVVPLGPKVSLGLTWVPIQHCPVAVAEGF